MRQGFTLLWMGWQWDVPERPGTMRMEMPIATENGRRITGHRPRQLHPERAMRRPPRSRTAIIKPYPVLDPNSAENVMTVRDDPIAKGEVIPRSRWRFVDGGTVALDGGFEPGRIYDVVYRTADPRVLGCGLAGTRDLVSFMKYDTSPDNPSPGLRFAIGWGVSQSGRFLRHFLYQGFNEDEQGRRVFDGVFDQVGGVGPRLVQPPLRPGVARCAAVLQHPVSGRSVPVHRRSGNRSGDRRDRQPARRARSGPARRRRSFTC